MEGKNEPGEDVEEETPQGRRRGRALPLSHDRSRDRGTLLTSLWNYVFQFDHMNY
jgi:hypothetical protein